MLQRVGQGIGSGSISEWGPASSGVVCDAPVHTTAGTPGLGDTSVLPSQVQSVKHAMVECSMFKAAAAVIQHYYGPVETGDGKSPVRDTMESNQQEWLLSTDQGWGTWSARSAHWRYRCEVKAGASQVFTSYLTTWLRELCEWIGFYSRERREQWRGFKQSLEHLRDTGVQPRQGEVRLNGGLSAPTRSAGKSRAPGKSMQTVYKTHAASTIFPQRRNPLTAAVSSLAHPQNRHWVGACDAPQPILLPPPPIVLAQSATTWCGTELVCAAVQREKH